MDILTVLKSAIDIISRLFQGFGWIQKNRADKDSFANSVALRFQHVLKLVNENRRTDKYQIAKLAQIIEMEKVGELEAYFSGAQEPSLEFLEKFAFCFGLNPSWLKFGDGNPYQSIEDYHLLPLEYLGRIMELHPEEIFFFKDNSEYGQATIVLRLSDWNFVVIPDIWHISSHVGGTGRAQIFSFYQLIVELAGNSDYLGKRHGYVVNIKTLENLVNGKIFPGSVLESKYHSHWWDDLVDIYHEYPGAENYEKDYGHEFILAQEIIRYEIEREKKRSSRPQSSEPK